MPFYETFKAGLYKNSSTCLRSWERLEESVGSLDREYPGACWDQTVSPPPLSVCALECMHVRRWASVLARVCVQACLSCACALGPRFRPDNWLIKRNCQIHLAPRVPEIWQLQFSFSNMFGQANWTYVPWTIFHCGAFALMRLIISTFVGYCSLRLSVCGSDSWPSRCRVTAEWLQSDAVVDIIWRQGFHLSVWAHSSQKWPQCIMGRKHGWKFNLFCRIKMNTKWAHLLIITHTQNYTSSIEFFMYYLLRCCLWFLRISRLK